MSHSSEKRAQTRPLFISTCLSFLLNTGETARPRLAGLHRGGQRLDRSLGGGATGELPVGHHIKRLSLVQLLEIAVFPAVLANECLGAAFRASAENLQGIVS